ncbi:unnamed protein product, partial [Brassica oleracea var. botrytis]
RVWRNGSPFELVDPDVGESCDSNEVTRFIHIALLCVQENHKDRPTLSTTIMMLTSNTITLPVPHQPGFYFGSDWRVWRSGSPSEQVDQPILDNF